MPDSSALKPPSEQIKPEDCPEPFWHQTHRYCPACSWREEPCRAGITVMGKGVYCNRPPDHDGQHEAKVNW